MDWRGIWEKVLAGVIGAVVVGIGSWFWGSWSAPEAPTITSFYSAMDIPNPIFLERDTKKLADVDSSLRVSGLAKYLSSADVTVSLGTLRIKNNSRVRSKSVEVSLLSGGLVRADEKISGQELLKKITIPSLDGLKEAQFIVLSNKQFFSDKSPVQLIYDDRTLDVAQLPDFEKMILYGGGTPLALIFAGLGLIAVIFLTGGTMYAIAVKMNPDLELKNMTATQVGKMLKQIEGIREKYPEKLPKEGIPALPPVAN